MIDLKKLQSEVFQNKVNKGFNITNIDMEFNLLSGELSEAFEAYHKDTGEVGEELADVAIFLLGLSEMLGVNLEEEVLRKMEINKNRIYKKTGNGHTKV